MRLSKKGWEEQAAAEKARRSADDLRTAAALEDLRVENQLLQVPHAGCNRLAGCN